MFDMWLTFSSSFMVPIKTSFMFFRV